MSLVNIELEQAVLCAVLDHGGYAQAAEAGVSPDAFGVTKHAAVWVLVCRLVARGETPGAWPCWEEASRTTAGALRDNLKGRLLPDDADPTGPASEWITTAWLSDLGNVKAPVSQLAKNIRTLLGLARQRRIIRAAADLSRDLAQPASAEDVAAALARLTTLAAEGTDLANMTLGTATDAALARHDALADGTKVPATWGVATLDHILPLCPGRTIVVAAPPGSGKTSIMLHAARETAWRASGSSAFLSLEVGPEDLAVRVVVGLTGVSQRAFLEGRLTKSDREAIAAIKAKLDAADMAMRPPASSQVDAVCGWIRAQHQRSNGRLRLVCVDYLQKISTANPKHHENDRLTEICGKLSRLAVELDLCFLVGSQFSREGTKGSRGKTGEIETAQPEPRASDLRGSGSIEQDANGILALWRKAHTDAPSCEVTACILKNREGESGGKIPLWWEKAAGRWSHVVSHHDEQLAARAQRMAAGPGDSEHVF